MLIRGLLVSGATFSAMTATPAAAQLDPLSYGEAAASIGRTQVMNEAITRQNAPASAAEKKRHAMATCASKDRLAEKYGKEDARIRRLYDLCAKAGY